MKFDVRVFCENLSRKINFHSNFSRITVTLRKDQYTFLFISRSVFLGMKNLSDKFLDRIKTHVSYFIFNHFFNSAVYEIMWKNNVEPERLQMTDSMTNEHCMLDT
jgi:hypothetical protein